MAKALAPNLVRGLAVLLLGLVASPAVYANSFQITATEFPLRNPFMATIAGAPAALQPEQLPDDADIDQADYALSSHPARALHLPDSFWAVNKLHYRMAKQATPSPLIFLIAGTGASFKNDTMEFLKRVFFAQGYHVVQLSSPTSYDFMAAASFAATPGISTADAADLSRVMQAILAAHDGLEITAIDLAGYSLGALHAAFIAAADAQHPQFHFRRVALLNPPVSVLTSTQQLDRLVQVRLAQSSKDSGFFELIFNKLSRFFHDKGGVDLSAAMLYDFQRSPHALTNEEMAMLIGSVFRFSAADMVFTSDVVNRRGHIVPIDAELSESDSLTPYFRRSLLCDFACYVQRQLLPHWQQTHPRADLAALDAATGLGAIADFLAQAEHIRVLTNADDFILQPQDFAFLHRVFQHRLTVFDHGGHLGNIKYSRYMEKMLSIFND